MSFACLDVLRSSSVDAGGELKLFTTFTPFSTKVAHVGRRRVSTITRFFPPPRSVERRQA